MGIVYGDAGIGKTEAIHAYMDSNIDAIKINCVPACAKPKAFLKKLCRKLRLQGGKNEDEYYDDIVEKLEGTNKILILDEAQHLPYKTLEHVRSIYDETGIGIILIGNHQIHDKLLGIQEAAFAQLFNRIAIRNPLSTNDVRIEDIQLIFGNIPKQSLEYLLNVANSTKWGIRGAVNVYMNAANNDDISVKGLQKMACFMGIYESR
ncbi:AAA family ATPase [Vallitalea guaymasensis]|nr:ATP-binding protein [Vallitalea guaymasensis]